MFSKSQITSTRVKQILLLLFAAIYIFCLARDLMNQKYLYYGDLRNRVVGTRLMTQGISPYFFKWNPEYPVTLYDPADKSNIENNMVTSPPSILFLMQPLGHLSYTQICIIWIVIHYIFFLIIVIPVYRLARSNPAKISTLIVAALLLLSEFWYDSVFRGQSHFLLPAFLSILLLVSEKTNKQSASLAGILIALLVWLQPIAVLLIPFLFLTQQAHRKNLFSGLLLAGIFLLSFTALAGHIHYWVDFARSGRIWSANNSSGMEYFFYTWENVSREKTLLPHPPFPWRSQISDLHTLILSKTGTPAHPLLLGIIFILLYSLALYRCYAKPFLNFQNALLIGVVLFWVAITTAPVLKMSYHFVELFSVLLFVAANYRQLNRIGQWLLAAGFAISFLQIILMNLVLAEWLFIASICIYLLRQPTGNRNFKHRHRAGDKVLVSSSNAKA